MPLNHATSGPEIRSISMTTENHRRVSPHAVPRRSSSGTLAPACGLSVAGMASFFPGALLLATPTSDNCTPPVTWYGPGTPANYTTLRAQQQFQDALVGNDERALPFIRPAYQALLFVPFSLLPYRSAYLAFLAVNLSSCWRWPFGLIRHMKNLTAIWQFLPVFVFLVFYPDRPCAHARTRFHSLAVAARGGAGCPRTRQGNAGPASGGLGLFKLQIVIPIALLFLLWRRWRFFAGFALSACLLSLVSLWVVGFAQTAAYARSLLSVGTNMATIDQFPLRVNIMANLRGSVFWTCLAARLPAFWIQVLTIVDFHFVLLLRVAWSVPFKRTVHLFVIAITASLIVSYYLFIHDFSVLLIPIVITLDRFILARAETSAAAGDRLRRLDVRHIAGGAHVYIPDSQTFLPGIAAAMRVYGHPDEEFSPQRNTTTHSARFG